MKIKNNSGFTLIELVIVIAIISVLIAIVIPNFFSFNKSSNLDNSVREFISVLKLAQNKTLSSENYDQYGVYLNTGISPNQYIIFKGTDYASRDTSFDQLYSLPEIIEFYNVNLSGGNQIIFDRLTGASNSGDISIRLKIDINQNKTVYISSSGTISFAPESNSLDESRVKDSRHLQFNYNRNIDTATENIILTFDNSQTETIQIGLYLVGGELQWQGTVNIDGTDQVIEINTHRLNNPDTLFSIHRDRRYNNKSLIITISGDSSG
jgi:prepilin-type N-terminal cleavage/methylation domain-containing protein